MNKNLTELRDELRRRTVELTAANRQLKQETVRRKRAEESIKKSKQHYTQLLKESRLKKEQLRILSHQLLWVLEDERKKISRELHDEIAQMLTGINVYLAALKVEAGRNTKNFRRNISHTQRLVEKSVNIVHQFARELRPDVLDDLGLIHSLNSYLKDFRKQSGIQVNFTTFAGVEQLETANRTILFRVAQSAFSNILKHSQASKVKLSIQKLKGAIKMEISDNGKGFEVGRAFYAKRKRLGLLGMRERLEMVGGSFTIESVLGQGTIIQAIIPFTDRVKAAAA